MKNSKDRSAHLVYIIEQDTDDIEILMELIKLVNSEMICWGYRTSKEALIAIQADVPQYIFLHINLPLLYGDAFLRELRQLKELDDTYIIVQSIDITPDLEAVLKSHGADTVIEKPWDIEEYLVILKNIFQ
jgi:response regulator RpfG family c-di-GMP phosphodiesterase